MFKEFTWRDVLYPSLVSGGLLAACWLTCWLVSLSVGAL